MLKISTDQKKILIYVFFLSLIIKIIFFIAFFKKNPCLIMYDSGHYHNIALQLIDGKGFTQIGGEAQFYRMPGYPVFLAACYKLFGVHPTAALCMQILLGSLIPVLIFILTLALFPGQILVAKTASIISCFDLGYIIFSGLLLSESLFIIFFMLFLILFLYNYKPFFCKNKALLSEPEKSHQYLRFFAAGLILGIACLIRPVGHVLFLVSIFMLLASSQKYSIKLTQSVLFSLGMACSLGTWIIRNYILTGYIFMQTLSGPHFLNHTAVRLCMMQKQITYTQAQNIAYPELQKLEKEKQAELGRPLKEIERSLLAEKLAVSYMAKNPLLTIQHFTSNMLKTSFGLYTSELLVIDSGGQLPAYSNDRGIKSILTRFLNPQVNNKFIIPVIYFEILFFLLLLLGLGFFIFSAIFNHEKLCTLAKLLPIAGCIIFITLACGYARLRLPIESFLIILASKALTDFWKEISRSRT